MTTNYRGPEVVIDAVISKLKNGLDARLATINAEHNDDLVLAAPGDGDFYRFGLPGGMFQGVPAVVVTELPTPEWEAEAANSFVGIYEIAVVVYEQDADRARLGLKLMRQCRAVIEVVWDDPPRSSLDGSAFHIRPVRSVPGPVFEADNEASMWREYRMVIFRARQYEGP